VPKTPSATPVSIMHSRSALRLEHGTDRAALRLCEVELADAHAREVDVCATAGTLLQASRAAEDRASKAERTAALAEREVGFLKALNVRFPPCCFFISFSYWTLIHV
jgi:hypothetical protein